MRVSTRLAQHVHSDGDDLPMISTIIRCQIEPHRSAESKEILKVCQIIDSLTVMRHRSKDAGWSAWSEGN